MESKIIDMLLDIKSDIGELKKGQFEIKDSLSILDGRVCGLEDDFKDMKIEMSDMKHEMSEMKSDISHIKVTVNALSDALITTSKEVKQLKSQR
jgi:chromosome segregation ATPase